MATAAVLVYIFFRKHITCCNCKSVVIDHFILRLVHVCNSVNSHQITFWFYQLYNKLNFFSAGHGPSILSPGIHSFPFKLGLPMGLPSTFLGTHGWVQYYCKAALREPNGLTHKNQQVFIVMNPIDLNLEPPVLAVSG